MNGKALRYLSPKSISEITTQFSTPVHVYSEEILRAQAQKVCDFSHAFGFTPRYAMKANSNRTLLKIFRDMGICIDASSEYEVFRALIAGYTPNEIQLTGQEIPNRLEEIVKMGVEFNATSLHQLESY